MWLYEGTPLDEPGDYIGFVYCITNTLNGKKYIGKKLFTKAATKQVKGKRKKIRKPSDWMTYYGSNKVLQEDVKREGTQHFVREVLRLCKTRGECNYYEAKYQMIHEVLESDAWYNDQIRVRVHRSHMPK